MRALGISILPLTCAIGLICAVHAQAGSPRVRPPDAENEQPSTSASLQKDLPKDEVPVERLEFKPQGLVPGIEASAAIMLPILCAPDGTPFISVPQPPTYFTQAVYSLGLKGAHTFSYHSIAGLYDTHFLGFFPGDSTVGLLVSATGDPRKSQYTVESPTGASIRTGSAYRGAHHESIVEFDRDGNYKSTVELPYEYSFRRFAELSDGNLVALAYDRVNAVAKLFILDPAGKIIRPLQIPAGMEDSPALRQGETGGDLNRARAETSMSWWLFAPARGSVLLYLAHSKAPLLEIGAGGATREVPIEAPTGYVLDGVIPSKDRWIIRFRRDNLPDRAEIDRRTETKNFVFYEVDPNDGMLRSAYEFVSDPGLGIACEQDGVMVGFSVTSDSKYVRLTAEIPR